MYKILLLLTACLGALALVDFGSDIQSVGNMPLHEAYITPIRDIPPLQAVEKGPPLQISEAVPAQPETGLDWIPGYWSWSMSMQGYIWTTGVWRRPPPDQIWIPGEWHQYDEGWVWLSGFWSSVPENRLTYIQKRPPDSLDEEAGTAPNSSSFWMSGYWNYNLETNGYDWIQGDWAELSRDWTFVPAHYMWRDKGYVFIPSYWDFPLDARGRAFAPVLLSQYDTEGYTYAPTNYLDTSAVLDTLMPYYPDYSYYYGYDYALNPDYWDNSSSCPSWWGWNDWNGLSWSSNWGLWWWYGHPGYESPSWLTRECAGAIRPASRHLIDSFNGIFGPANVTSYGVFTPLETLHAGQNVWGREFRNLGRGVPVFPANQRLGQDAFSHVDRSRNFFKPTGTGRTGTGRTGAGRTGAGRIGSKGAPPAPHFQRATGAHRQTASSRGVGAPQRTPMLPATSNVNRVSPETGRRTQQAPSGTRRQSSITPRVVSPRQGHAERVQSHVSRQTAPQHARAPTAAPRRTAPRTAPHIARPSRAPHVSRQTAPQHARAPTAAPRTAPHIAQPPQAPHVTRQVAPQHARAPTAAPRPAPHVAQPPQAPHVTRQVAPQHARAPTAAPRPAPHVAQPPRAPHVSRQAAPQHTRAPSVTSRSAPHPQQMSHGRAPSRALPPAHSQSAPQKGKARAGHQISESET